MILEFLKNQIKNGFFWIRYADKEEDKIVKPIVEAIRDKEYETINPNEISKPIVDKLEEVSNAVKNIPEPKMPEEMMMSMKGVSLVAIKGDPGDIGPAGKDVDEDAIIKSVMRQIRLPKDGKDADERKIIKEVLARIPIPKDGQDAVVDYDSIIRKVSKEIKQIKGERGYKGEKGDVPKHKWEGSKLYFENSDGSWDDGMQLGGRGGLYVPGYFHELHDVPHSYKDQALKLVRINSAENALEFVTPSSSEDVDWGEIGGTLSAQTDLNTAFGLKVDKVTGKGLSTNDYDDAAESKLAGIEAGANNYSLPTAAAGTLGGVKVGTRLSMDGSGVLSADVQSTDITGKASLALDNLASVAMNAALQWNNSAAQTLDIAPTANTVVGRALAISAGSTVTGGTADMAGGNLTLNSGLGKGTGASSIIFQTGRTLTTGSTLQTLTTAMTILGSGNVGIGTTNPSQKLQVLGKVAIGTDLNPGSAPANSLIIGNTSDNSYIYAGQDGSHNTGFGWVYNATPANAYGWLYTYGVNNDLHIDAKNILLQSYAGTGNVGIGTTAPTAVLHLKAGTATANTAPLKFTTGVNTTVAVAGQMEYNNTFWLTNSDATIRSIVLAPNATKITAAAPYTNDGYVVMNIAGTDFKVMTTA